MFNTDYLNTLLGPWIERVCVWGGYWNKYFQHEHIFQIFTFTHDRIVNKNINLCLVFLCFSLPYSKKAFVFLCLRGVCISWFKWKLPETLPPTLPGFCFHWGHEARPTPWGGKLGEWAPLGKELGWRTRRSQDKQKGNSSTVSPEDGLESWGLSWISWRGGRVDGGVTSPQQQQLCDIPQDAKSCPHPQLGQRSPSSRQGKQPSPAFMGPCNATNGPFGSGPTSRGHPPSTMSWFFSPRPWSGSQCTGALSHEWDLITSYAKGQGLRLTFIPTLQANKQVSWCEISCICAS